MRASIVSRYCLAFMIVPKGQDRASQRTLLFSHYTRQVQPSVIVSTAIPYRITVMRDAMSASRTEECTAGISLFVFLPRLRNLLLIPVLEPSGRPRANQPRPL